MVREHDRLARLAGIHTGKPDARISVGKRVAVDEARVERPYAQEDLAIDVCLLGRCGGNHSRNSKDAFLKQFINGIPWLRIDPFFRDVLKIHFKEIFGWNLQLLIAFIF